MVSETISRHEIYPSLSPEVHVLWSYIFIGNKKIHVYFYSRQLLIFVVVLLKRIYFVHRELKRLTGYGIAMSHYSNLQQRRSSAVLLTIKKGNALKNILCKSHSYCFLSFDNTCTFGQSSVSSKDVNIFFFQLM